MISNRTKHLFLLLIIFSNFHLYSQNEHLKVKQFTLENGLKVYLNEDQFAQNVFGAIAVNAGSKNDPAEATGIAHYLEHLLFKGTQSMGTWNYEKEKIHLDSITYWYEQLALTQDENKREYIQKQINSQAIKAAKYSLPNDFDGLLKSIGATGVNAFTSPDMTFYHNSFPTHQVEKWLDIYAHRFQNPVFRSFQSELEVVYEEKNRAMDNFEYRMFETFMKEVFAPHPYGTQTTLGDTEHLKNPSLEKMYEFFNTYYVANNMALILTGNFNSDEIIPIIKEKFGVWKSKPIPEFPNYQIQKFEGKKEIKVRYTPLKAGVLAFKTGSVKNDDYAAIQVMTAMLSNQQKTGLLDELVLKNDILYVEALQDAMNDDGVTYIIFVPKIIIQSFNKAEKLIFNAIKHLQSGNFDEELLNGAKNRLYIQMQMNLENNKQRGIAIGEAFNRGWEWNDYLNYLEKINDIDKNDIIAAANQYLNENHLALYSKMGFPKKEKLEKPPYKALQPNNTKTSEYATYFKSIKEQNIEPSFLDFENDAEYISLGRKNDLYITRNPINNIFSLKIKYEIGKEVNNNLKMAIALMKYSGTKNKSMQSLKQQWDNLGATYQIALERDYLSISIKGKEENLEEILQLLNQTIHQCELNEEAKKIIAKQMRIDKQVEKKTPSTVGNAMRYFVIYGNVSSYINRYSRKDIKNVNIQDAEEALSKALDHTATLHYTGNNDIEYIKESIQKNYTLSTSGIREKNAPRVSQHYDKNTIYIIHNKKALQSQVYFYIQGKPYNNKEYSLYQAFNTYIGDGFSGLVLQEIREYRSLAYSAWARYFYFVNNKKDSPDHSLFNAFVACQSDKTNEAIDVMMDILQNLPQKEEKLSEIITTLEQKNASNNIAFRTKSETIDYLKKLSFEKSPQELAYDDYAQLKFDDIMDFYKNHLQNEAIVITIYGNKNNIDLDALKQYGDITFLKIKDVLK